VRSLISKINIKVMQCVPITEWSTISICCHTGLYRLPSPHVHMTAHMYAYASHQTETQLKQKSKEANYDNVLSSEQFAKFAVFHVAMINVTIYIVIGVPQDSSSTSQYAT